MANKWPVQRQADVEASAFPLNTIRTGSKQNYLSFWGNKQTMNLNHLIYENIMISPYYNKTLLGLKTYHEVLDEIYQHVDHLEPWERGTRRTTGQTGMCGGVRGVGAGGVISSAFCILYKLFTLKLTRKQLISMLNHNDSCYIRGLGFMYIRYCLNPNSFWYWFEPYLDDDEEIDPKSGGGGLTTMGALLRQMLNKLDWYSTLFPRIPVPIQKDIEKRLQHRDSQIAEKQYNESVANWERSSHERNSLPDNRRDSSEERLRRGPRGSPDVKRKRRSRSRRRHADRSSSRHRTSRSTSRHRSSGRHRHRDRHRSSRLHDHRRRRSKSSEHKRRRHCENDRKRSSPPLSKNKDEQRSPSIASVKRAVINADQTKETKDRVGSEDEEEGLIKSD